MSKTLTSSRSYCHPSRCLLAGIFALSLLSDAGAREIAPPKLRKTLGGAKDDGRVGCLAFSPDGKSLVSGGLDGSIRLWDLKTGKGTIVKRTFRNAIAVHDVAFRPDGKSFAAAYGVIQIWDARSGKGLGYLPDVVNRVWSLAFTPDGKTLIAARLDYVDGDPVHSIQIWDVDARKRKAVLTGHGDEIYWVSISRDGKTLASASEDRTVKLWDLNTGKCIATLAAHGNGLRFVCFSPDGCKLATAGGGSDDVAKLWDVKSRKIEFELKGHNNGVTCLAFTSDGETLISGSFDTHVRLWDTKTGKNTAVLRDHKDEVLCLAVSPDGKTLATGSSDKTIKLWDLAPACLYRILSPTPPAPAAPAPPFVPDAKAVLPKEAAGWWADLAGDDAEKAYDAVLALGSRPAVAVALLGRNLKPAAAPDRRRIAALVADLGSDRFAVRDAASKGLAALGEWAETALRKAAAGPDAEARNRAGRLLKAIETPIRDGVRLRAIRSAEALEMAGTDDARRLLAWLATGAPEATLTREASASLRRLDLRKPDGPRP